MSHPPPSRQHRPAPGRTAARQSAIHDAARSEPSPAEDDGGAVLSRPVKRWGGRLLMVAALLLTVWLVRRTLANTTPAEIAAALRSLPVDHLVRAGGFAAASYACLTLFDAMAVRYVGRTVPYRYVAFTSFTSLSIGHSVGLAGLSSGAIRYRYYALWGLGVQEVAKILLFTGLTVGVGLATLAGVALVAEPGLAAEMTGLSPGATRAVGLALLGVTAGYTALAALVRRPLTIRRFRLEMPPWRLAAGQVVIGSVNFALVAACLHQCVAGIAEVGYLSVAAVYVSANVATLVTHVPGGLGVIESVVLQLVEGSGVIGAVIAFRVIYFLIPLALGGLAFAAGEVVLRARKGRRDGTDRLASAGAAAGE